MDTEQLIKKIDEIRELTGHMASTVCGKACNDPLLYERLLRRRARDTERFGKLTKFEGGIADTRPSHSSEARK